MSVACVGPLLVSALGFVLASLVAGWGAVLVGGSLLLVVTVWLLLGPVWVGVVAAGLSGSAVSVGGSLHAPCLPAHVVAGRWCWCSGHVAHVTS